ncbi:sensor histidine kinase [Rhodococcoides navarretei]|uniref:ATP-binding protein n=1 Tax=Rhodococcus navarretei TaxID=3128981 RepID=A0ABU9D355_9NOCA
MHGPSAEERLARYMARFASAGAFAYLALLAPQILSQFGRLQPWYTPLFVCAIFGPALGLSFASFRWSMRRIRTLVTSMAVAYLIGQVLWLPAFDGPLLELTESAWIAVFPGLISVTTAIAWSNRAIFTYLVLVASFGQVVNYYSRVDHGNVPLFSDIVFGVMFCGLFTVTVTLVVRTGRLLDTTRVAAEYQAATAAASAARSVERERFDALIHDDVMSTLLSAARAGNSPALTAQSSTALARLDRLRSGIASTERVGPESFLAYLRSALSEVDDHVVIDAGTAAVSVDTTVPMDAVRALSASAAEALRNSVRHAGDRAEREVHVRVATDSVRIDVRDDGCGFDPGSVAPHRLGLAVSIRGRMRQVPGGSAEVTSEPGSGTTVTLTYRDPGDTT